MSTIISKLTEHNSSKTVTITLTITYTRPSERVSASHILTRNNQTYCSRHIPPWRILISRGLGNMKSCQSRRQDSKYQNRKNTTVSASILYPAVCVFDVMKKAGMCSKHVMRQLPSALHLKQRNNRTPGELKLKAEKYSYCINNRLKPANGKIYLHVV